MNPICVHVFVGFEPVSNVYIFVSELAASLGNLQKKDKKKNLTNVNLGGVFSRVVNFFGFFFEGFPNGVYIFQYFSCTTALQSTFGNKQDSNVAEFAFCASIFGTSGISEIP